MGEQDAQGKACAGGNAPGNDLQAVARGGGRRFPPGKTGHRRTKRVTRLGSCDIHLAVPNAFGPDALCQERPGRLFSGGGAVEARQRVEPRLDGGAADHRAPANFPGV